MCLRAHTNCHSNSSAGLLFEAQSQYKEALISFCLIVNRARSCDKIETGTSYSALRVRLVRGTGRDGTERGVPSRVWCAKNGWNGLFHGTDFGCFCVPPLPPGTGLFHVCGTQCFTILRQIYPMSFSKITPSFRPVPSRSVPSRPRTKRTVHSAS
ncbi:unnamed protein product [Malus baccata var. baccata]